MKKYLFPLLIALAALSISASAAFYSVTGLSKLFAGASLAVLIMASSLEFSKLVIASLLYQYWNTLNKILRTYLSIACFVLIIITSLGIYGFLSGAYASTAALAGNVDKQVELLDTKKNHYEEQLAMYTEEKTSINQSITDLRNGLANNKIQYTNANGDLITTTSSSTRKSLEKQLDQAIERQTTINGKIDELNAEIFDLETQIVDVTINNDVAAELGSLRYISDLFGVGMDKVVNILLLIIVFVFDPLAISLVIAANFAFAKVKPKVKKIVITPQKK
jgi:hypothetical protein